MREKIIEEKLTKAVKQNGGVCWKFTSPGTAGVPDRIVLMPGGRIAFEKHGVKEPSFCFDLYALFMATPHNFKC